MSPHHHQCAAGMQTIIIRFNAYPAFALFCLAELKTHKPSMRTTKPAAKKGPNGAGCPC